MANVPDNVQLEVAQIAAQASIHAAKIAARGARISGLITAAGTVVALIGTGILAWVAYRNVRAPLESAEKEKEEQKIVLLSRLHTTVGNTLSSVDRILDTYRKFDGPVQVRVLTRPETLESHDQKEFDPLGPDLNKAIEVVEARLKDYRSAKRPLEDRVRKLRKLNDDKPVELHQRPDDFDLVIAAADAYRSSLARLELLVGDALGALDRNE